MIDDYNTYIRSLARDLTGRGSISLAAHGAVTWMNFRLREPLTSQGWKVHISCSEENAAEFIICTIALFRRINFHFKIAYNIEAIEALNMGYAGETQIGKIATVYAGAISRARAVADEFDALWRDSAAPEIKSDLRLNHKSNVFLRYGAFTNVYTFVDSVGRYSWGIRTPDDKIVPDTRKVGGCPPAWVIAEARDLLEYPTNAHLKRITNLGFASLGVLHRTPFTDVYLVARLEDFELFILKAAPRRSKQSKCLENEFVSITSLQERGFLSNDLCLIDVQADLVCLVIKDRGTIPLDHLPRDIVVRNLSKVCDCVASLHKLGWGHGDIKPGNIVLETTQDAMLIDFGLSSPKRSISASLGTRGYMFADRPGLLDLEIADQYALACTILWSSGLEPSFFAEKPRRMLALAATLLHKPLHRALCSILRERPEDWPSISELSALLVDDIWNKREAGNQHRRAKCRRKLIRKVFEAGMSCARFAERRGGSTFWHNAHIYEGLPCEGVVMGSAGVVLGLMILDSTYNTAMFCEEIDRGSRWLSGNRPLDLAHGLLTGNAGVAIVLGIAARIFGDKLREQTCLVRLQVAARKVEEFDLHSGAAGVIWAAYILCGVLGKDEPACIALPLLDVLKRTVQHKDGILFWKSSDRSAASYLGAAHGSAGIGMALARFGRLVGDVKAEELGVDTLRKLSGHRAMSEGKLRKSLEERDRSDCVLWCHGDGGLLWSLLQAVEVAPSLRNVVELVATNFLSSGVARNLSYCHGIAGQLEIARMLCHQAPSLKARAVTERFVDCLLASGFRQGNIWTWYSDVPGRSSADVWLGCLGPAASLALYDNGSPWALLSPEALGGICMRQPYVKTRRVNDANRPFRGTAGFAHAKTSAGPE
jgi:hypothetical protein